MPSGYMKVVMSSKKPKTNFPGRYCMLQSWPDYSDLTVVKKAYNRMVLLHNLFDFGLPMTEMINIYILYIRSILESSAVVWHSSITQSEERQA